MAVESVDVTPRRWTVGAPSLDWPPAYSPAVERVAVREDRITDDDIEKVTAWFAASGGSPSTHRQHAIEVLSLVLGVK
jgi:hypothetical protein